MTPLPGDANERWAVATLDRFAGLCGYVPVPEPRPASGGWRRLYVKDHEEGVLAAVGSADARFASLGVEIPVDRRRVLARVPDLVAALAPYEAALDLDAGADPRAPETVVRVALRLFLDGLTAIAARDAIGNLLAAAAEARRTLA